MISRLPFSQIVSHDNFYVILFRLLCLLFLALLCSRNHHISILILIKASGGDKMPILTLHFHYAYQFLCAGVITGYRHLLKSMTLEANTRHEKIRSIGLVKTVDGVDGTVDQSRALDFDQRSIISHSCHLPCSTPLLLFSLFSVTLALCFLSYLSCHIVLLTARRLTAIFFSPTNSILSLLLHQFRLPIISLCSLLYIIVYQ